jgi:hypothetical protein
MVMPVTKGGFVRLFFSINGHISQTLTWKFIWWNIPQNKLKDKTLELIVGTANNPV